uniref:Uncharacterized protein n=1 Tax=Anguilla anguilla TaxID=7936 RepID=A0A0E9U7C8_ANGAN
MKRLENAFDSRAIGLSARHAVCLNSRLLLHVG